MSGVIEPQQQTRIALSQIDAINDLAMHPILHSAYDEVAQWERDRATWKDALEEIAALPSSRSDEAVWIANRALQDV